MLSLCLATKMSASEKNQSIFDPHGACDPEGETGSGFEICRVCIIAPVVIAGNYR